MPAHATLCPSTVPGRASRLAWGALAVVLVVSLGAMPEPAAARDLSPIIASLRGTQTYYESIMRSADVRIRALDGSLRRARRALAKARRSRDEKHDRLERRRELLRSARQALGGAESRLAQALEAPPVLQELGVMLRAATIPPLVSDARVGWQTAVASEATVASMLAGPAMLDDAALSRAMPSTSQLGGLVRLHVAGVLAARGEVDARAAEVRTRERAVKKARQRLARASRNVRQSSRRLGSLRAARRAGIALREGAEAGLGNAILAMSSYAQRRIAKKTKQRPGVTSGFIWPTRGYLSQGYGRGHDGVDIAGYQGTPIRAAAIGVVSYIGWNPWDQHGRAFMIVVAHPGGLETLYGHALPTRAVRVGEVVRQGQVIGYMGSTGNATGVHLHLELRRGRTTLNPLAYL